MPDKPSWYLHLDKAIKTLEQLPTPWVDGAALSSVLQIGRRRAQQLLRPLIRERLGRNGLALRQDVIERLRRLAESADVDFETQRRDRLHKLLNDAHKQLRQNPPVFVEAPAAITDQELGQLPRGIQLSKGRILIEQFSSAEEAKQLLLALIFAIGNNPDEFDTTVSG
jgi:hypothetical protein